MYVSTTIGLSGRDATCMASDRRMLVAHYTGLSEHGGGGDIIPQILTDSIEGRVETILDL